MGENLKAFIVDDERLQRNGLKSMLLSIGGIEIAGEAATVAEAVKKIENIAPDVIFLDIQMPGGSGFDLLDRIETDAAIVFITAYDKYAIRAFEVNALDYLLKPVEPERLAMAINRLAGTQKKRTGGKERFEPSDSVYLRTGSRSVFLRVVSISYIEADGDYSEVHTTDGKSLLFSRSIREWERRLPEDWFQRIHRSVIVNIKEVDYILEKPGSTGEVFVKGSTTPLKMSRRRRREIVKRLK